MYTSFDRHCVFEMCRSFAFKKKTSTLDQTIKLECIPFTAKISDVVHNVKSYMC